MTRPLIATKLYVPRRKPGLVGRPRLLERLRAGSGSRLTLLSAPAGFGKTTLLAEWLGSDADPDRAVAWLSLDRADHDAASFWTGVATAFDVAVLDHRSRALELTGSTPLPVDNLLTVLVNELAETTVETWLVLDDYHLVDNRDIDRAVAFLLDHLPPHVHVVISTRADPDLPLSRWRVRGELVEVRAADLRFTPDEAEAYLNDVAGLALTAEQVIALEQRTEGWIAALQLAALSLRGRADVGEFIARFDGDDRYVVDYLVDEVLNHQPEAVRRFLARSAVLDRLTGSLCDAVTGDDGGREMLTALERANLFVVPLDDRREWYRFQHLFADVLRARLLAEQPDLVPILHDRASRWYEQHDLTDEAVRHAMAAGDIGRVVTLMELAVASVRRNRQESAFMGWLKALPDEAIRRSPVLSVFSAYAHMASGQLEGVEPRLVDAERELARIPTGSERPWADTDELRTLPATIAVYRASLAQARGDIPATKEQARRALEKAGPTDHLARGSAAGFLGLAAWADGDVTTALETFTQAVGSLHAAGALVDELSSTVILADLWLAAGRPDTAGRLYQRALRQAEAHGDAFARATADLHVGMSETEAERGDLDGARRHLATAASLGDPAAMAESGYRWFVAMARVAEAEGDPAEALALLDRAAELYRPSFFPDVRPIAAMRARVRIRQGDLRAAGAWAAERGVAATDDPRYLREFDHLTLVRLLIARHRERPGQGSLDDVPDLLDRLEGAADPAGRSGSVLEIRMLRALTHEAQGLRPSAVQELARGLAEVPEPEGYRRLFLEEGRWMTALLRDVTHPAAAAGQARRLLGTPTVDSGTQEAARAAGSLSDRELQVLRLLDSELSGPEIARRLFVSPNTLRTHTKHIFAKLDVTSRRAAVRKAQERGLM